MRWSAQQTTSLCAPVENAFVHDIICGWGSLRTEYSPAFQWTLSPRTRLHEPFSQPHYASWQQTPEQKHQRFINNFVKHLNLAYVRRTFQWDYAMLWKAANDNRNWCHSPTNLRQFQLKKENPFSSTISSYGFMNQLVFTCIFDEFGHQ